MLDAARNPVRLVGGIIAPRGWHDTVFLVIEGYVDGSNLHDGTDIVAVAGCAARKPAWEAWEKKWDGLLELGDLKRWRHTRNTYWAISRPTSIGSTPTAARPTTAMRWHCRATRHAPPRRRLPSRARQAASAHWQAGAGPRTPHHCDDDVPRDGHALLVEAG